MQGWLTHAIFRRGSVAGLASRVKDCPAFSNQDQYLEWAAVHKAERFIALMSHVAPKQVFADVTHHDNSMTDEEIEPN